MNLKQSIEKLMHRQDLDFISCQNALETILAPEANPLQTAVFLVLLRSKTESIEEISALVNLLQDKMIKVPTAYKILDIVGTGGDGFNTINLSTGSAILAASCGIKVAKHGNHAVSSLTGSADVLTALGVQINLSPEKIAASIDQIGIGFCFSPNFHPALQTLRALRKQLNVPTSFNLLAPLLNPTQPAHLLLGVYDQKLLRLMAETLAKIGTTHSMVVHGCGLDEISCLGRAEIIEVKEDHLICSYIDPEELGLSRCTLTELQGGDAQTNAQLLLGIFAGKNNHKTRAIADSLILNTAVSLMLYGCYASIAEALPHAQENLSNGSALTLLKKWIEFSYD